MFIKNRFVDVVTNCCNRVEKSKSIYLDKEDKHNLLKVDLKISLYLS